MLIAQVTDLHIGFDRDHPDEPNLQRLRKVLARLAEGPNRPDMVLLTGDLTENGDAPSFAALKNALADFPLPVWPIIGNHDERGAFAERFPEVPKVGGFFHYAIDFADVRILMLDTVEPGRHGGAFCEVRADWLRSELAAHPQTPTLIAMHHPPIVSGIDWMDGNFDDPWIARFADVVCGQSQIKAILCGHLHRTIMTSFEGIPLVVCPSSAPAVALDLTRIDPETPDGRVVITDEPPAYALHRWDGGAVVSHFESLSNLTPLARFDGGLQGLIRMTVGERG